MKPVNLIDYLRVALVPSDKTHIPARRLEVDLVLSSGDQIRKEILLDENDMLQSEIDRCMDVLKDELKAAIDVLAKGGEL